MPLLDLVKHGTPDQATCGAGCSGNRMTRSWAFSPIAHGDLHGLGRSIQRERFQLTHDALQYPNHAATNWTPFYQRIALQTTTAPWMHGRWNTTPCLRKPSRVRGRRARR
ncbi:MAG: hypothetical protein IPL19_08935 [Sandaracinaceae bacterium]|nr:hypothetical protein [Sandaracinaceae bacterium]